MKKKLSSQEIEELAGAIVFKMEEIKSNDTSAKASDIDKEIFREL